MRRDRPFRLTIRGRLTLVYGGLFLLAGVLLLGVTYFLAAHQLLDDLPPTNPEAAVAPPSDGPSKQLLDEARSQSPDDDMPAFLRQTRENALRELLSQGAIALGLVGAAAIGFGWLIAGRLLQPLHRITGTARRIADAPSTDRGLRQRIALHGPRDEVKELADTFDLMLDRLDHSFDGQRRFIANASHELRTPLTLNRALIEVELDPETVSPDMGQVGAKLLAVNNRHERLLDGLLLLARSERDVLKRSYVDLADIVEHAVEHATARTPADTVDIRTELAEAPTAGNPVLLERLAQNLIENGVKYNVAEHGWVSVTTGTQPDGTVALRVGNTGPVVPRHEVPHLFEPFHRLDGARTATAPGAGLGLSIVRAVARAHGGEAHAEARAEGGLVVTVTLPTAR
jgi:signal transduction histidine kinase